MDTAERQALVAEALSDDTTDDRKTEVALLLVDHVLGLIERATIALESLARASGTTA